MSEMADRKPGSPPGTSGGLSLESPPGPRGGGVRPSHASAVKSGMTVIHPSPTSGASSAVGFRRVAGLVLVLVAAYVGIMDAKTWSTCVSWVENKTDLIRGQADDREVPAQPESAGTTAESAAEKVDEPVARQRQWLWLGLVVITAAGALSLIRSKPFSWVITTVLIALAAYCAAVLFGRAVSWRPVVFGAVVLGYLIHSAPRPASASVLGSFALILVAAAGLGAARAWPDWSGVAARMGSGPGAFAANWAEELTWGTVLLPAMLGVLWARTKTIHFLIAVLLVALAYHCVMSGRIEVRTFPELTEAGEKLVTAVHDSYSNVQAWRWVAAVELVLISAVLLHKALGVGALNVAFALAWMFLGCSLYNSIRSLSFLGLACDWGKTSGMLASSDLGLGPRQARHPLANMGLPLSPPATRNKPGALRARSASEGSFNPRAPRAVASTGPATQGHPARRPSGALKATTEEELGQARAAALASVKQMTWREAMLPVWMYLTVILAGVIAAAGLHLLSADGAYRAWLSYALWLVFGFSLAALWFLDPREPEQSWTSWISDWTQSKYRLHAIWAMFLGSLTVAGSWALRPHSRAETWMHASIYCAFLGTVLTLISITLLDRFGGFATLPVWIYGAIAAGQSSLAWVIMMHLSFAERRGHRRDGGVTRPAAA